MGEPSGFGEWELDAEPFPLPVECLLQGIISDFARGGWVCCAMPGLPAHCLVEAEGRAGSLRAAYCDCWSVGSPEGTILAPPPNWYQWLVPPRHALVILLGCLLQGL